MFAAGGGEGFDVPVGVAEFGFEVVVGLGAEGEEAGGGEVAGAFFSEADEACAVALAFVGFADVEAANLGEFFFRPGVDGDDAEEISIDFEDGVVCEAVADLLAVAIDFEQSL